MTTLQVSRFVALVSFALSARSAMRDEKSAKGSLWAAGEERKWLSNRRQRIERFELMTP